VKILHLVGARPNFMKVAPILAQLKRRPSVEQVLVHTGQHYDAKMSDVFFQDLGMPEPDVHLGVGSGSHAQQTARVMVEIEPVLAREKPDVVVVAGDVNSTIAVALVASKMGLAIATSKRACARGLDHARGDQPGPYRSALRSPLHAVGRRRREPARRGHRPFPDPPGGKRDDRLAAGGAAARPGESDPRAAGADAQGVRARHPARPANVDEPAALSRLLSALAEVAARIPVVFPIHPRTRSRLPAGFEARGLKLVEPLGYLDFLALTADARLVMTDSGGIQEETTALGVPCLTMRENTERPVTVEWARTSWGDRSGSSDCGGSQGARGPGEAGPSSELWTAGRRKRVAEILVRFCGRREHRTEGGDEAEGETAARAAAQVASALVLGPATGGGSGPTL